MTKTVKLSDRGQLIGAKHNDADWSVFIKGQRHKKTTFDECAVLAKWNIIANKQMCRSTVGLWSAAKRETNGLTPTCGKIRRRS